MAIVTREGSLFIWRRGFTIAGPTAGSFSQAGGILLVLPVTRLNLTPPVSHAKRHLTRHGFASSGVCIPNSRDKSTFLQGICSSNGKKKKPTTKPWDVFRKPRNAGGWGELGRKVSHNQTKPDPCNTRETSETCSFPTVG